MHWRKHWFRHLSIFIGLENPDPAEAGGSIWSRAIGLEGGRGKSVRHIGSVSKKTKDVLELNSNSIHLSMSPRE